MTARIIALCVLLAAAACWWSYEKGRDSIIKNVIAGSATFQKEEAKRSTEDVKQASLDTQTITQLETERDRLQHQNRVLQANAKAAAGRGEAPPSHACTLPPDVLGELQDIANGTKPPTH